MAHGGPEGTEAAGKHHGLGVGGQVPRAFAEGQRGARAVAYVADALSQIPDGLLQQSAHQGHHLHRGNAARQDGHGAEHDRLRHRPRPRADADCLPDGQAGGIHEPKPAAADDPAFRSAAAEIRRRAQPAAGAAILGYVYRPRRREQPVESFQPSRPVCVLRRDRQVPEVDGRRGGPAGAGRGTHEDLLQPEDRQGLVADAENGEHLAGMGDGGSAIPVFRALSALRRVSDIQPEKSALAAGRDRRGSGAGGGIYLRALRADHRRPAENADAPRRPVANGEYTERTSAQGGVSSFVVLFAVAYLRRHRAEVFGVKGLPGKADELHQFVAGGAVGRQGEPAAVGRHQDEAASLRARHDAGGGPAPDLRRGVQLDHFWYSVRAWGPHMTSWLVDYGRAETWADVEKVINRNYCDTNGEVRTVNLACIDSGYNTDEVYQFCAEHMDVAIPSKGSSTTLKSRYTVTVLDKGAGYGLRLYHFDPNQLKDYIAGRLHVDAGAPGSWNVCRDVEQEYCDQVCAEQRVEQKDKKGRISRVWEKVTSHAQNHYLDTETNNILAAEILGVRYLMEPEEKPAPKPEPKEKESGWLGGVGENWL